MENVWRKQAFRPPGDALTSTPALVSKALKQMPRAFHQGPAGPLFCLSHFARLLLIGDGAKQLLNELF